MKSLCTKIVIKIFYQLIELVFVCLSTCGINVGKIRLIQLNWIRFATKWLDCKNLKNEGSLIETRKQVPGFGYLGFRNFWNECSKKYWNSILNLIVAACICCTQKLDMQYPCPRRKQGVKTFVAQKNIFSFLTPFEN